MEDIDNWLKVRSDKDMVFIMDLIVRLRRALTIADSKSLSKQFNFYDFIAPLRDILKKYSC